MKTKLPFGMLALTASILTLSPRVSAANTCGSWAKITKDVWDYWGARIKASGCKDQAECLAKQDKREALVKEIIAFVNKESQGSWATFGPRPLLMDSKMDGKIVAGGERLFLSQGPMVDRDELTLQVVKEGGKASAKVTVSIINPDNTCSEVTDSEIVFSGDDKRQEKSVRVKGLNGKQLVIKVDAKGGATKAFDYYVVAK